MPSLRRGHPRTLQSRPPISRGQKIGISNNRAGQISHVVISSHVMCSHCKITIIIVGRPVQPNSHRSGGSKGPAPGCSFLVPNSSSPQHRTYRCIGQPLLGLLPPDLPGTDPGRIRIPLRRRRCEDKSVHSPGGAATNRASQVPPFQFLQGGFTSPAATTPSSSHSPLALQGPHILTRRLEDQRKVDCCTDTASHSGRG